MACATPRSWKVESPGFAVDAWLVDCPSFYRRAGGLYQDTDGKDWPDNAQRFALLAHAGAQLALGRGPVAWRPDIVHLNDWQTGPLAALLARESRDRPACVFTIHNLAFQGLFGLDALDLLGLPSTDPNADGVEFWGQMSFLKAGICCADRVTTVSEEYASEILTPQFGCGLDRVLRGLRHSVIGIRNGIDDEEWDPSQDPWLPARYRADDLRGKEVCKERLRNELGLVQRSATPLIACLNRLTHQKMADLLPECLPTLVAQGAQVVVLGRGDPAIEKRIEAAVHDQGDEAVAIIGYEEALAHRLLAGADILLAPARFEPCGLTQMYAMYYGTVPVASRLGGLAETITDCAAAESGSGTATGPTRRRSHGATRPRSEPLLARPAPGYVVRNRRRRPSPNPDTPPAARRDPLLGPAAADTIPIA